jgi:hypothetical protein
VPVLSSGCDNTLILQVIEKGLDSLGTTPKQAIWIFLEKDFNVKRDELPGNLKDFREGLQKIFGLGYKFLDTLFCHYLQEATGKKFQKNLTFVECVESLSYPENCLTR